ncbi:aldo/keto reductase [Treponema primitia ZAS-2]|uniref:Aldo/keto reductase n=1 Tax=Treponema primitia (strain ATCC BAA-887 / DSM 12427 / ZAS-2) TaxID=545694 RepID=F5YN74_TREPZ|nr:aldo/keto reductase [Treponema primitia]AEF84990.1 aldo/keto reductase [Treponema primitia ZAS-2]
MQYRLDKKTGNKLSVLGFGSLRFPKKFGTTDLQKTEPLVMRAIEGGVNYFDAGYFYFGSEEVLGTIFERNKIREKVHFATKMPLVLVRGPEDFDKFFNKQLERIRSNYIDYYLIHMLPDIESWKNLCKWGIEDWIREKKRQGAIRSMGFSFHGRQNEFLSLIDAYDWDFCQIQYNYSDENFQAGVTGLKKASAKGMPVMIMEPLLGGKLVGGLSPKAVDIFKQANPDWSPAGWGFRWLWNQKEVTVTLSGMTDISQIEENLKAADTAAPGLLSQADMEVYGRVQEEFKSAYKVLCTGCNYCMPCPQQVNIPACFAAYNISYTMGRLTGIQNYIFSNVLVDSKEFGGAGLCIKCGACEKKCSQNIPIIKTLQAVRKRLEPPWVKWPMLFFGGLFKKFGGRKA